MVSSWEHAIHSGGWGFCLGLGTVCGHTGSAPPTSSAGPPHVRPPTSVMRLRSERVSPTLETRMANDLQDVMEWVNGGTMNRPQRDANFQPKRLDTLRSRNTAAYKGISVLNLFLNCTRQ